MTKYNITMSHETYIIKNMLNNFVNTNFPIKISAEVLAIFSQKW